MKTLKHSIFGLLAGIVLATSAHAETTSFKCNFPLAASPDGIEKEAKPWILRFVSDNKTKKAYFIGNNGSTEVTPIVNQGGGVSFLEITQSGNVMVTTITSSGEAVHSRNSNVLGELLPSQRYGKCDVR